MGRHIFGLSWFAFSLAPQAGFGGGSLCLDFLRTIILAIVFILLGPISLTVAGGMDDERLVCLPAAEGSSGVPHGWYFFEGKATRYWLADGTLKKKKYGPYEEMFGKLYFINDELQETTHLLDLKNMLLEHIVSGLIYRCETKSSSKKIEALLKSYMKARNQ